VLIIATDTNTGLSTTSRDELGGCMNVGLFGLWHKAGVTAVQAQVWNIGVFHSDAKGDSQPKLPGGQSTDAE